MDLWVMAAAAAAGYLSKYWQNVSREEGLSEQLRDKSCPLRQLRRRPFGGEGVSSGTEMASTSGFHEELLFDCLSTERNVKQENGGDVEGNNEMGDQSGMGLVEFSKTRCRSSIRCRRPFGSYVKPLSSLESCLVAQLYKENVEMEEYVLSSFPSPSTSAVRPLLLTDGSRIISRSGSNLCSVESKGWESKLRIKEGLDQVENDGVLGEESLSGCASMQLPKKLRQKRAKRQHGRLSNANTKFSFKQFSSQGSPDGMLLFCIGVTVGVISTVIANKREVDKLNELLKQTKNFVQDLQEELEMKDSMTVKELTNEGYDSQETNDHSFHNQIPNLFSSSQELGKISNCDVKRPKDQNSESNSESMNKIEAELEAELERLELNMNASSLNGRFAGLVELDQDFMVDMVQGELRADRVNEAVTDSDGDVSGVSTNQQQNVNYAVSPRELSMRLHEVIQSRLEERISELENALQNSQRRVNYVESNQNNSWGDYNSEKDYSSWESPNMAEGNNTIAGPLFLNISADALDAYNEAYEEFSRQNAKDEDDPSFIKAHKINQFNIEKVDPLDHSVFWGQDLSEHNGSLPHVKMQEELNSSTLVRNKILTWEERIPSSRGSSEVAGNEDENEDDDGEEMAQLLKQIVEKTRQGSPLVLNAQRVLFGMD